ncbi:hypothetical protein GIY30_00165 [Gordonia sp. HNM0687]|uniref:Inosine/uridine-preferring nucleoside hydrolase domain-containing protein n=1 Tax=Gordonia mangrovi TaxID=2665643 RepID=A0A6L7GMM3_9ACTN|nr:nucleoside hydrolase [Gordonia mangrovi]MXP19778.1 hypothetical protein [Gordonia mangrovi]UVF79596.1 nucleoside hydrolase [Gordonia mangrovi]
MRVAGAPDILVDTDGGLDDAIAVRAIAAEQRLWGVTTTWGAVSAAAAARNIALAVPDCEVVPGARTPPPAWRVVRMHGLDGAGGTARGRRPAQRPRHHPPAPDVIVRFARDVPDGTLVCLGPLTNLARAVDADADALAGLRSIVISAGVGFADRAVRAVADTNTRGDPRAAAVVTRAVGLPIRWVGLDVSRALVLRVDDLPARGIGDFASMRRYGLTRHPAGYGRGWSAPCHDLVAAAAGLDPACAQWRAARMRVRSDHTPARVVAVADDAATHLAAYALDVGRVRGLLRRGSNS